ncbi:MAG: hypothetical protein ABRQ39_31560 [Candidatus Eremiobacterota bacterium]
MKHCSEKDLLNFSKEKTPHIEEHLKTCSSCLMKYNFLTMKVRMNSYIEYEKRKKKSLCPSEEDLFDYASGRISEDRKKQMKEHLALCETCVTIYFDLKTVNMKSLWLSIEEAISRGTDFIKNLYFVPDLAYSRKKSAEKSDKVKAFIGDEVRIEIPADKDGYLTVIHWNGEKVSLLFPNPHEIDTSVKEKTTKILRGLIDPPAGIQYIKVFVTEDNILNPEEINFNDVNSVMKHIEGFMKKLSEFDDSKWSEKIIACEVMEFSKLQ